MSESSSPGRNDYRVAIPLQQPVPKPSLIPADVWHSYQQQVQEAAREESQRHVVEIASTPVELPDVELSEALEFITSENDVGLGASVAADPEVALFALSQVSLFADVQRSSLEELLRDARQGEVGDGEYLFREGDHADSFYVVIEGALEILRRRDEREVALRHMGRGEAIGLFGLFSGQVRAACARAIGEAVVLEVPCASLSKLVEHDADLHDRLLRFYQERLLEGFLGSSRLFSDIDSIARARLIGRFAERHYAPGETIVAPGEVSNLLAVIISGKITLEHRPKGGQEPRLFELFPGQYVAVIGAFSGAPSKMRVYAAEHTTVAMLGHRELAELLRDYPALRSITARLPSAARALDRDIYCGHTGVPGL